MPIGRPPIMLDEETVTELSVVAKFADKLAAIAQISTSVAASDGFVRL